MDEQRWSDAVHEAGHAVVRWRLDGSTGAVTIEPDEPGKAGKAEVPLLPSSLLKGTKPFAHADYNAEELAAIDDYIRRGFAGVVAEQRVSGRSLDQLLGRSDIGDTYGIARSYWPDEGTAADGRADRLISDVERLVDEQWQRIERLARVLYERGTLTAAEVGAVLSAVS